MGRATDSAAQRTSAGTGGYPGQRQNIQYPAQHYNANNYPGAGPPAQRQPQPPQVQATYTIRNELNLNKGSMKLVRKGERHCLCFDFDTEAAGQCTVFLNASEDATPTDLAGKKIGETWKFPKALSQSFEQSEADSLNLASPPAELRQSGKTYPLVVLLEKELTGTDERYASQTTFAEFDHDGQGNWSVKPLKQKIKLGDDSYELQEIYGIELHEKAGQQSSDDNEGVECVVCMTNPRDTTVLPCRHMCLCANCAKILRFQSNKCPVCREQVASLLQIKVKSEGES